LDTPDDFEDMPNAMMTGGRKERKEIDRGKGGKGEEEDIGIQNLSISTKPTTEYVRGGKQKETRGKRKDFLAQAPLSE